MSRKSYFYSVKKCGIWEEFEFMRSEKALEHEGLNTLSQLRDQELLSKKNLKIKNPYTQQLYKYVCFIYGYYIRRSHIVFYNKVWVYEISTWKNLINFSNKIQYY